MYCFFLNYLIAFQFRTLVKKCSACNFLGYCDKECQKEGWKIHKYECKSLKKLNGKVEDNVRFVARILQQLKKGKREEFSKLKSSKPKQFNLILKYFYSK